MIKLTRTITRRPSTRDLVHTTAWPTPCERSVRPRSLVHCSRLLVALLATACGERYEIGELRSAIDDLPVQGLDGLATVVVSGAADADFTASDPTAFDVLVGDIDGDGLDDRLTAGGVSETGDEFLRLTYGAPRDASTGVAVAGETAELFAGPSVNFQPLGDVDGDGFDDLAFGTSTTAFVDLRSEAALDDLRAGWATQRLLLWYGGPRRTGAVDVRADAAVITEAGDANALRLLELELVEGENETPILRRQLSAIALGDIDGDTLADFAFTAEAADPSFQSGAAADTEEGSAAESGAQFATAFVFYGARARPAPERTSSDAAAQLDGIGVSALGDLDGDGAGELVAFTGGPTARLIPGTRERLSGTIALASAGVPVESPMLLAGAVKLGDVDGDAFDDFALVGFPDEGTFPIPFLFYGGPDRARQPISIEFADAAFPFPGSFAALGDWNGDGLDDIIVHYFFTDGGGVLRAEARVLPGRAERYIGQFVSGVELEGNQASELPAEPSDHPDFVFPLGDIDGDGFSDLGFRALDAPHIKFGGPLPFTPPR